MSTVFGVLVIGIPAACLVLSVAYLAFSIAATLWPRR